MAESEGTGKIAQRTNQNSQVMRCETSKIGKTRIDYVAPWMGFRLVGSFL